MKNYLKKSRLIVYVWQEKEKLKIILKGFGILPIKISLFRKIPNFIFDIGNFINKGGKIHGLYPILNESQTAAGVFNGMYFHQDLLVSQYIFNDNPIKHIDVGSRIDGFVAHVASFRRIEVIDIRNLPASQYQNIVFKRADIMNENLGLLSDSVSCLNAIEHIGLGRYGDKIDVDGHLKSFTNLIKMVKPGGKLYISFPIGKRNQVIFNAHRIFHPLDIFNWSKREMTLLRFDYVDDFGEVHMDFNLNSTVPNVNFGCGIYTFMVN